MHFGKILYHNVLLFLTNSFIMSSRNDRLNLSITTAFKWLLVCYILTLFFLKNSCISLDKKAGSLSDQIYLGLLFLNSFWKKSFYILYFFRFNWINICYFNKNINISKNIFIAFVDFRILSHIN